MKVREMISIVSGELVAGENGMDNEITGGYVSDMLSDVMGNADSGMVWVTMQAHQNILAVASLKDIAAIVIVGGHQPLPVVTAKANEEDIPLVLTQKSAFEVSGILYRQLSN